MGQFKGEPDTTRENIMSASNGRLGTILTGHALPRAFALFLRLAQISPMAARSPARRSRDEREPSGKTSCEVLRVC
jgi:hypothetical protein